MYKLHVQQLRGKVRTGQNRIECNMYEENIPIQIKSDESIIILATFYYTSYRNIYAIAYVNLYLL